MSVCVVVQALVITVDVWRVTRASIGSTSAGNRRRQCMPRCCSSVSMRISGNRTGPSYLALPANQVCRQTRSSFRCQQIETNCNGSKNVQVVFSFGCSVCASVFSSSLVLVIPSLPSGA